MMFPVLDRAIYKVDLLSRSTPVEYMPYTVKEQKILLMARESKELGPIIDGLRQIISNCLVDKSIDVAKLPLIDLEWLFLQIQAKSSGEKNPVYYKCTNAVSISGITPTYPCDMLMEFEVDLTKVQIHNKTVEKKIIINDKVGIMMKLPTFESTKLLLEAHADVDHDQLLAAACIDYVFDDESVYKASDASEEEMLNFVEQLPPAKYELIENFFDNCPIIRETIKMDCPKCGYKHQIVLEGLEDFFV